MSTRKCLLSMNVNFEDHDYFKKILLEYRAEGNYGAALFADMVKAFKEKRGE